MRLRHARIELELHELSRRQGPALLLLHALGGSSADWAEAAALWAGRVYALDFCGHGRSHWVRGGVYYPELLAGDADAALAHLGTAAVAGAGVGAYVALLLAGARRDLVHAALLLPGRGLAGGGGEPDFDRPLLAAFTPDRATPLPHGSDPALRGLECDPRPTVYATRFATAARRLLLLEDSGERPPWWMAVRDTPAARAVTGDLRSGIVELAAG